MRKEMCMEELEGFGGALVKNTVQLKGEGG